MNDRFELKVRVKRERPDFRVFASYFFGEDLHDFDSDGDSEPVTSRTWTQLYMRCRTNSLSWFDIDLDADDSELFTVSSDLSEKVFQIAYFLARETEGVVFDANGNELSLQKLVDEMGDFDLKARLEIAEKSVWRQASEDNPFPNLVDD